jgi:hypothetical protein
MSLLCRVDIFSWNGKEFTLLSEASVPEAVTALHWGSSLVVATAGGLHVLDPPGKSREVLKWRSRGAANLTGLTSDALCVAQDCRLHVYSVSGDAAKLLGAWQLTQGSEESVISTTGDVCTLADDYAAVATPEGVAVYFASPDAPHGRLQLLQTSDAVVNRETSGTNSLKKELEKPGAFRMRARGHGGPATLRQVYVVCCKGGRLACAAPDGTAVAVGDLGSPEEQMHRLRAHGLSREALFLCGAREGLDQEGLLDDIRIEHGVRLCSEVWC